MKTSQELIKELVELADDLQETNITRTTYRKHTKNPDSYWEKIFGTWTAFVRAAGLGKSKSEKKILNAISRNVDNDHLRKFNELKTGWEEKYLRPSGKRFQSIVFGSDQHDIKCDPFYRGVFIDVIRRVKPEKVLLGGDVLDMYEFSLKYTKDPRNVDIMAAIDWVHEFLADIREASPESEIVFISGNHENRLFRYLAERAPEFMPILSDLHGFTPATLLGLDKYEVNFISKDSLASFKESDIKNEIAKNYYIANDTVLFHHHPHAKQWGMPGINGHHHKFGVDVKFNAKLGPYEWWQSGCGHVRQASYCEAEKWQQGFLLVHLDTHKKYVQFEPVNTTYDHCIVGGKFYNRNEDEIVKLWDK